MRGPRFCLFSWLLLCCLLAAPRLEAADAPRPAPATAPAPPFRLVLERTIGHYGVGPGEFSSPRGVTLDPLGRILVADTGNHRVERFDSSGVFLGEFGGFGYDENRFDRPTALWSMSTLAVWVLDQGNARVVKYDLEGRLIGVVVALRSDDVRARLDLIEPEGLATDRGGQLYVTDAAGDRILLFDPLGAILTPRGGFGTQRGRFDRPTGIAVDDRGRLLVGDAGNRRVQMLDPFGESIAAFPLDSAMTGREGLAVAFGPDSTWAMADRATGRLVVCAASGAVLARHVPLAKGDPRAGDLAFDARGRLLVTDTRANRVVRYRLEAALP